MSFGETDTYVGKILKGIGNALWGLLVYGTTVAVILGGIAGVVYIFSLAWHAGK